VAGSAGAIGGPVLGIAIGKVLSRIGLEVYDRLVVTRQRLRVGAFLGFALSDAEERAAGGEPLRDDGFFEERGSRRSDAEELMEGLLLQAADAYQELKLRHLGAILPSLAVRRDVSAADGHWLMHLAERLTWRQLVVLAIFHDPPDDSWFLNRVDMRAGSTSFRDEVEELGSLRLLGVEDGQGGVVEAANTLGRSLWSRSMMGWRPTNQGRLLVEIARLDEVPEVERQRVLRELVSDIP
jgi:hypothetical protein